MPLSNRVINTSSVLLIQFVTFLFIFKYSERFSHSYFLSFLFSLVYCAFVCISLLKVDTHDFDNSKFWNKKGYVLFILVISLLFVILINIVPESSQVSRLPAMNGWLSNLCAGKYPYNSQYNPSGFPILFFIAFPFYLMHNLGYLEVLGYLLFSITILIYSSSIKDTIIRTLIFLTLPMFFYEIIVRSELFFNIVLTIYLIIITKKYLLNNKIDIPFILTSVMYGLLLSTRLVVGIVIAIFTVHLFRNNLKMTIPFALICGITFFATLIPFIVWDKIYFISNGPFSIQLLYLPRIVIVAVPLLILYFAYFLKKIREVLFYNGIVLFALVLISFISHCVTYGLYESIFQRPYFDISYFIFPIPFLILSISNPILFEEK